MQLYCSSCYNNREYYNTVCSDGMVVFQEVPWQSTKNKYLIKVVVLIVGKKLRLGVSNLLVGIFPCRYLCM